jgi:hypothetical protein
MLVYEDMHRHHSAISLFHISDLIPKLYVLFPFNTNYHFFDG